MPDGADLTPLPRTGVLVVLHADGWVEAYADETVRVLMVQRLHSEHDTGRMSTGIDAVIDAGLPWAFKELFVPGNCRAADQCRETTPTQALRGRAMVAVLRVLREDAKILRDHVTPAGPCEIQGTGHAFRRSAWNESNESDELEMMRCLT